MSERSILTGEQVSHFDRILSLDPRDFAKILRRLKAVRQFPVSPSGLRDLIGNALTSEKRSEEGNAIKALANILMGMGTVVSRGMTEIESYLDAIRADLKAAWASEPAKIERWDRIRPPLVEMLSTKPVRTTVKALDIAYEYANLLQFSRIMTDVRPVFNEDGDEVEGAVVAFTLRMNLLNAGHSQSLSIALDALDLRLLLEQCERALQKAETVRNYFSSRDSSLTFAIVGAEDSNESD